MGTRWRKASKLASAFHEEQITLPAVTASRASANIEAITHGGGEIMQGNYVEREPHYEEKATKKDMLNSPFLPEISLPCPA